MQALRRDDDSRLIHNVLFRGAYHGVISVAVDRYIVSFDMTDRCCASGKRFCAVELTLGDRMHLSVHGP